VIKIIVATSRNRVIGNDNTLIWHLPADLKNFKRLTTGSVVIMGRKTYESIGKPLPYRRNIIITRDENYKVDNCEIVNSLEESLLLCNSDCFIIGGGEIYKQVLPIADEIYLTLIDEVFEGDTYFPEIGDDWFESERQDFEPDEKNKYKYSFIKYERYKF
jgi:dihydrofolate reductase